MDTMSKALMLLAAKDADLDANTLAALTMQAQQIVGLFPSLNSGQQSQIRDILRQAVASRQTLKRILAASTRFQIDKDPDDLDAIFEALGEANLALADKHAAFMTLYSALFHAKGSLCDARFAELYHVKLRGLYQDLSGDVGDIVDQMPAFARSDRAANRVAILTPQYLSEPQATTVRTNEYARCLIEQHTAEPIIIKLPFAPAASVFPMLPPLVVNRTVTYRPFERLVVGPHEVASFHFQHQAWDEETIIALVSLLTSLAPKAVIALGAPNLAAEAAALCAPTFVQPTTAEAPIVERPMTMAWSPLDAERQSQFEALGLAERLAFVGHPGFSAPETGKPHDRADKNAPAEAVVFAVVGNRLNVDVDHAFLDCVEEILDDPRAFVAFIGRCDVHDQWLKARPRLRGRTAYWGYEDDILAAYAACDVFLNPDRQGGGRAAAYAMSAGLPVLALGRGDVAATIGVERCCKTYDELVHAAHRLINDREALRTATADARRRANDVIGVNGLVEQIFSALNLAPSEPVLAASAA